jgi:hypothetical protein
MSTGAYIPRINYLRIPVISFVQCPCKVAPWSEWRVFVAGSGGFSSANPGHVQQIDGRTFTTFDYLHVLGGAPWIGLTKTKTRLLGPNVDSCKATCASNPQCKYGTYLSAGVQAGECWLASALQPNSQIKKCGVACESFYKTGAALPAKIAPLAISRAKVCGIHARIRHRSIISIATGLQCGASTVCPALRENMLHCTKVQCTVCTVCTVCTLCTVCTVCTVCGGLV